MGKNQGLVITLIIFIILTLGLGTLSYFMSQGYKETLVKFKEAETKIQNAEGEIRTLNSNLDKIKEAVGYPGVEAAALLSSMDTDIKNAFGDQTNVPKDYKGALILLAGNLKNKTDELATATLHRDQYQTMAENEETKARVQKEEFDHQVSLLTSESQTRETAASQRYDDLSQSKLELVSKIDTIEKEAKKINEDYRVQTADANEVASKIATINVSLRDKLDEITKADIDIPDGQITYVDPVNQRVRISIGSGDDVRLLTPFSVYPHNALELGTYEPKGSVEVVRIISDHESEARILTDEMRNPFVPGDLLHTPVWKRGDKVQFALDYFLDVDKDKRNDIDVVANLINSSGSMVAAWIDEDGQIHGKITPDVTYFISANESVFDLLEEDMEKSAEAKDAIKNARNEMIDLVRKNSVREVRLSEFLRRTGYRPIAEVSKFLEPNGVKGDIAGPAVPNVSSGQTAPIYLPGQKDRTPISTGTVAPIYDRSQEAAPAQSPGRVSDYYFRKRTSL